MSFQGSKLLEKMGYIPGRGLGKDNEGTTEPVSSMIEANKGRSQFGAHPSQKRSNKQKDKKANLIESDISESSDEDVSPKQFCQDHMEVDEEDNVQLAAKRLIASNQALVDTITEELQSETANLNLLKKSVQDLQLEVQQSEDLILGHRSILDAIDYLEAISKNEKLEFKSLWYSIPSSLAPTTKSHMIQVFALPLLRLAFSKVKSSSYRESLDLVDLEQKVFADMIDVAREWLKTKSCIGHLITWYQEWTETLKPYLSDSRIKYFRRRLLDVMYLATIQNPRDLNSFKYVPYEVYLRFKDQKRDPTDHPRLRSDREIEMNRMNFRQFVEYTASEQGLLFRPLEGRSHDSKQLYKLEKLSLYISDKVIFVKKNDQWIPRSLNEVLELASNT